MTTKTLQDNIRAEIEAYDRSIAKEKREQISSELSRIYSDVAFNHDIKLSEQLEELLKKAFVWYRRAVEREEHSATLFGVDLMVSISKDSQVNNGTITGDADSNAQ